MKVVLLNMALCCACAGSIGTSFGAEAKSLSKLKPLPVRQVSLSALPADLVTALKNQEFTNLKGRYQIGLGRNFDQAVVVSPKTVPASEWSQQTDGSRAWSLQVTADGALGIRLHVENLSLPAGVLLRVYDPQNPKSTSHGITQKDAGSDGDAWMETIFSSNVVLECDVPANVDTAQVSFTVSGLSHLYLMPVTQTTSNLKEGTCHADVTCYPNYATEASGVARITFIDSGNSYLCTGCLLASSASTSDDYFLTAHHCISSQTIASSMECFWFYQTSTCNGAPPDLSTVPHTTGGGDLLAGSTTTDFSFLRLRQGAPGGAAHLEWSTATPGSSETMASIHHPTGSYKRISIGNFIDSDADFWAVQWNTGVTEPGSSGGPLLNSSHRVIGQLNGGWDGPGSSCANPSGADQFGRFDGTYPAIQNYLGDEAGQTNGNLPPKGSYYGLFSDGNNPTSMDSSGYVTLTESGSKGKFSGRLQIGTKRYGFHGQFHGGGSVQVHINRNFLKGVDMTLQYDGSSGEDQLTGMVTDGDWQATVVLNRAAFTGRGATAPQWGKYTFILPGDPSATNGPVGNSYGTVSVDKRGMVHASGSLADGTRFTQSTALSAHGEWPFYVGLYAGQGAITGPLTVSNDTNAITGTVVWMKLQTFRTRYYKSGFVVGTDIVSSTYNRPFAGTAILNMTDGQVTLAGGNLSDPLVDNVQLTFRNRLVNMGANRLTFVFATGTGAFNGRMTDVNTRFSYPFHGVVLQSQNYASGYFTGPTQTGEVTLTPGIPSTDTSGDTNQVSTVSQ